MTYSMFIHSEEKLMGFREDSGRDASGVMGLLGIAISLSVFNIRRNLILNRKK